MHMIYIHMCRTCTYECRYIMIYVQSLASSHQEVFEDRVQRHAVHLGKFIGNHKCTATRNNCTYIRTVQFNLNLNGKSK